MISFWSDAYFAMRVLSTAAMLALDFWAFLSVWRVIRNRPRFYDPMRAVIAWPTTNTLWYQARSWIFGQHIEVRFSTEVVWYAAASICTIAGAHLVYITIRSYECNRDPR